MRIPLQMKRYQNLGLCFRSRLRLGTAHLLKGSKQGRGKAEEVQGEAKWAIFLRNLLVGEGDRGKRTLNITDTVEIYLHFINT